MSHSIVRDTSGTFCTKCGLHSEDSLNELCKSSLHEEQIKTETEFKKMDIESKKMDIESKKLDLWITFFLVFMIIIFIGFEKVAVAIQNVMVIAKSAYEECSMGGCLL